ncbi:RlmE family RNA methyltransferase, partial [Candidatus Pacearchaeota archaeon]|nr:RlmE family RNA methyltransferase [Candidatus Pacearchaeota archaeon]
MPRDWLKNRKKDHYYRLAKKEKFRSRAAYKLLQINDRFSIIDEGDVVVDLGCAPGGWSLAALELVGRDGKVVGVDMKSIQPIEGLVFVKGDLAEEETVLKILEVAEEADAIISDMSPRISGNRSLDQARFLDLCENAIN